MNDYTTEAWKDVKGYEGIYRISDHGKVFSVKRNALRKTVVDKGYEYVQLHKDGKRKRLGVHRLVAMHFVKKEKEKREVNHKDENSLNNKASNLMWCTSKENANWGTRKERISKTLKETYKKGRGEYRNPYCMRPYNLNLVPNIKIKNIN